MCLTIGGQYFSSTGATQWRRAEQLFARGSRPNCSSSFGQGAKNNLSKNYFSKNCFHSKKNTAIAPANKSSMLGFLKLQQDQHHSCLNRTPTELSYPKNCGPLNAQTHLLSMMLQGSMPESNQAKLNKNPSSSKSKGLKDKEMVGSSVFHLAQKVKTRFIPPSARGW